MNTPNLDEIEPDFSNKTVSIEVALNDDDGDRLNDLLGSLTISEALREVLSYAAADQDRIISMVSPDLASRLNDEAEAILAGIDPEDAAGVRRLVEYPSGTAGGLMLADAFTFRRNQTVGAVLRSLASDDEDLERYNGQHPYIIDDENHPVGVVSLRGLLTAKRSAKLEEIMITPLTVGADAPLDTMQEFFDDHDFLGFPVVDDHGTLVGVVSRTAVDAAGLARLASDNLRRQGIVGDELRTKPLAIRSRRRLAWLSANIVLNIIAASVTFAHEETLAAVIAIAVFLPMVSDMSGCSGNQAVGVTMRELSLGLVRPKDAIADYVTRFQFCTTMNDFKE